MYSRAKGSQQPASFFEVEPRALRGQREELLMRAPPAVVACASLKVIDILDSTSRGEPLKSPELIRDPEPNRRRMCHLDSSL
jgi:hypothetical protein